MLPPSREDLERRIRARGQDSEDEIRRRLEQARQEILNYNRYDFVDDQRRSRTRGRRKCSRSHWLALPRGAERRSDSRNFEVLWRLTFHERSEQVPESQFAYVVVVARRARQLMINGRPMVENPRSRKTRGSRKKSFCRGSSITNCRIDRDRRREGTESGAEVVSRALLAMKIALGVTGGVAAYKAAELVRRLQQEKLDVQVVMTRAAQEFITPLTFAALTGKKVITEMFGARGFGAANVESAIEHIAVAQRIDLLLVAPATADILGKFAHGIADDFLTTLYLATKAPVVVAPAMNVNMWEHPATQSNLANLRARGVHVVDPDEGYLACGMTGAGRLAATEAIAQKVCEVLGLRHDLAGQTVLVTAGPTCEDLDPVRFLTNRSSGKMGYALAEAACVAGRE